jgi:hypothetical protein
MLEAVLPIECQKDWENLELTKSLIIPDAKPPLLAEESKCLT